MLMSKSNVQNPKRKSIGKRTIYCILLSAFCLLAVGCRYDMQDQPRYKPFKKSDFFNDGKAMRELPAGTVARGMLREDKVFYTGKKLNIDPNAAANVQTTTNAAGNTLVSSFPNDIEKMPVPLTRELLERGEQRYKVFCIVCHGPVGNGDGMIVRRGFTKPPTYNDDRLRNAPDGHFFDVMTNGWGKMSSYASQIPPADRWAIVAYIRALQVSQNPNAATTPMTTTTTTPATGANTAPAKPAASPAAANNSGGAN